LLAALLSCLQSTTGSPYTPTCSVPPPLIYGSFDTSACDSPVTILLVEDETLTRLMLIEELEGRGYTVIEAADADEALTILRADKSIRLLFTDMKMPGTISGLDLVRIARAEHPAVKVIIGSAHIGLSDWASEADAAFEKPYELKQVVAKILELIGSPSDHSTD
jgi:CheY-like chemotaxis protein